MLILNKDIIRITCRLFYCTLLRLVYTASAGAVVVVDEDGLSGVGDHVVVVKATDG